MATDLTKIYQKYKGLWVALKDDKVTVVAAGKTVKEALSEANTKGFNDPILFKVPTRIIPQIGAI